jgi:hypothetical protein
MSATKSRAEISEIGRRGEAIYKDRLREVLEPRFDGQFIVIDVDSGDYEVDPEDMAAFLRLQARRPNAEIWGTRVGRSAAYEFGLGPVWSDD